MCGIAGIIVRHNESPGNREGQHVLDMLKEISHRGPDQMGLLIKGDALIGANRLSITDRHGGDQPICSCCSDWSIAFNGEIYNFQQLRKELNQGHSLRSDSDTEVLLHLFEDQGEDCFRLLNGMFAFCITDGATTYLVRDRFGIKPLYYRIERGQLRFASEAKSLVLDERPRLNLESTYLNFETNVGNETLFKGIFEVPRGSYLCFNSLSGELSMKRYYSMRKLEPKSVGTQEAIERTRWLVKDAVRVRTNTDLCYGCSVSGGLDSAIVASLSRPKCLFSAVVRGRKYLEEESYLKYVESASSSETLRVTPSITQLESHLVEMVYALDFPVTTLAGFTQFVVCEQVNKHQVRILLSGLGADEFFGGYVRYAALMLRDRLDLVAARFPDYKPLLSKTTEADRSRLPHRTYFHLINRGEFSEEGANVVKEIFSRGSSILNSAALVDMSISFPPLLRADDRLNMYFGIEGRSPFLDHRIVEFALSLEDSLKIRNQANRIDTKFVLREAFKDVISPEILERRDKVGFPSPVTLWLNDRYNYVVNNANRVLQTSNALKGIFDNSILSDTSEFSRTKWHMVQFAAWYLIFFEKCSLEEARRILFHPPRRYR